MRRKSLDQCLQATSSHAKRPRPKQVRQDRIGGVKLAGVAVRGGG